MDWQQRNQSDHVFFLSSFQDDDDDEEEEGDNDDDEDDDDDDGGGDGDNDDDGDSWLEVNCVARKSSGIWNLLPKSYCHHKFVPQSKSRQQFVATTMVVDLYAPNHWFYLQKLW